MSFVRLENLNDFIEPSKACIKPVEKKTTGIVTKVNDVSLSDCLACSGCITSAESVLVEQQNHEEFFKIINDNKVSKNKKHIVISLSLQTIASLAHKFSLDVQEAAERIASFFISLGCHKVYDINLARHLALVESYKEYLERKKNPDNKDAKLPILSSVCPGWICYAEKTNGDIIIPHLSKVKSPQQIMGALLNQIELKKGAIKNRNDIYHVTLMPCFDKKLEASRQDFKDAIDESQDVDCVLTPVELEEILRSEEVSLLDFSPRKLDILVETDTKFDKPLTSNQGSASGGYAENIFTTIGQLPTDRNCSNIDYKLNRGNDFLELKYHDHTSEKPTMAIVNGFRNIQTVVQRLKRDPKKWLKYDYIEIMACPSGCINGGAQCRPNHNEKQEEMIESCKQIYNSVENVNVSLEPSDDVNLDIYCKLHLDEVQIKKLLYTNFQPVPKMPNLSVAW